MSTDRRIYSSQAVYIGPSPSTSYHFSSGASGVNLVSQLIRVQSLGDNKSITRQNVNEFAQLAAIDRAIIDAPTVAVNLDWLAVNANNESGLGFTVNGTVSAFSGIINGTVDDRNIFNLIAPNDEDAIGNTDADTTFVTEGYG